MDSRRGGTDPKIRSQRCPPARPATRSPGEAPMAVDTSRRTSAKRAAERAHEKSRRSGANSAQQRSRVKHGWAYLQTRPAFHHTGGECTPTSSRDAHRLLPAHRQRLQSSPCPCRVTTGTETPCSRGGWANHRCALKHKLSGTERRGVPAGTSSRVKMPRPAQVITHVPQHPASPVFCKRKGAPTTTCVKTLDREAARASQSVWGVLRLTKGNAHRTLPRPAPTELRSPEQPRLLWVA
jgi:hypothetical protein